MLPESIEIKKNKNVCVIFWLPCLPYENGVNWSKVVKGYFFEHRFEKLEKLAHIIKKKCD